MPNYLNQHYKNCMVDSKENDKFGLGVKELTVFNAWLSCEFCLSNMSKTEVTDSTLTK